MKQIYISLLIFITFNYNNAFAQAPILDSTVAVVVGQIAQINIINNALSIPSGNPGPAQTYDYSVLPSFNSSYEILGIDNLTSPFGTTYPNANATVSWSSFGNPYYHFQLTDTSYTYLGGGGSFGDYEYIDAYDQLRFPFTYNDTYTDSYLAISNIGGYRSGTVTLNAEGYGTLLVPNQTFNDVLRVKRASSYYDTINGNPRFTEETYYEYYKPGIPHYILLHGFYTITTGTSNPVSGSQLFYNSSTIVSNTNADLQKETNYSISQNGNQWSLNAKNNSKDFSSILNIYNLQGQLLMQDHLNFTKEIASKNLQHQHLANGLYLIQFINAKGKLVSLKWNKVN